MGIVCREFCCVSAAALAASLQISARTSSSSSEENFVSKNWFDYMSRSGSTRCLVFRGGGGHFPSQRKNRRRHQVAERDLTNHRRGSSGGTKKTGKRVILFGFPRTMRGMMMLHQRPSSATSESGSEEGSQCL